MFFISYICLQYLLLCEQLRCHLVVGKVNNEIQRSLPYNKYYQEDEKRTVGIKRDSIIPGHRSCFGDCPENPGRMLIAICKEQQIISRFVLPNRPNFRHLPTKLFYMLLILYLEETGC